MHEVGDLQLAGIPAGRDIGAQQVLCVQHADNVVRIAAPERHTGVGRSDNLAHKFVGREIGVDEPHLHAVDHHVGHGNLRQLKKTAEHVPFDARDLAFLVQDIDRAHELFVTGNSGIILGKRQAAQAQDAARQHFHRLHDRTKYGDKEEDERCDHQRYAVGIGDCDRLRHDLAEDDNQRRHDARRRPDAVIAVKLEKNAGRDRR